MRARLKVEFSDPEAGWMDMTIRANVNGTTLTASYVLFDTLDELVDGVRALAAADASRSIRFFEEPGIYMLRLENESGIVRLEIFPSSLSSWRGQTVFEASDSTLEVCLPFWRALRNLQARFTEKEFERRWHHPFPTLGTAHLGATLASLRAQRS